MISAITHDLKTPLTKLQLRFERVEPEELRVKLKATAAEMSAMVDEGLDFARSLSTKERPVRLELGSFLDSIAADSADVGARVAFRREASAEAPLVLSLRAGCLRRAVTNLTTNTLKYAGSAEIVFAREAGDVVIRVLDEGPGIPEEELEAVFEPYYRLESSRNSETGGTGLGLCIARNMAALNGARLTLRNRAEGGLAAEIRWPAHALGVPEAPSPLSLPPGRADKACRFRGLSRACGR